MERKAQTSIDVYHQIVAEGLVGKLQAEVVCALAYAIEELTQKETMFRTTAKQISVISPRFTELEDMGVIIATGTRPCRITGRIATTYRLTGGMPIRKEKRETKDQTILRLIARVAELEELIAEGACENV